MTHNTRDRSHLTVAVDIEMNGLDPNNLVAGAARRVAANIAPGLLAVGPAFEIVPALASSWEQSRDGTVVTVRLEPGARFHSGRPVLADAVVENFARILAPDSPSYQKPDYGIVAEVVALDERTVQFRLHEPFAPFPALLANSTGMTDVSTIATRDPRTRPVGAGPYEMVHWEPGDRLELRTFSEYHRPGLPRTERVTWRFVPDGGKRVREIVAGTVDLACALDPLQISAIEAAGQTVAVVDGHGPTHLVFACDRPPFSDLRVRRAIAHAIDRPRLLRDLTGGIGVASCSPFAPSSRWYAPVEPLPYDPELARSLLAEAGYGPADLRFTMPVNGPHGARMGAAVAAQLQDIGIALEVEPHPNPRWWPGIYTSGTWQIALQTWTPMPDPDQVLYRRYHTRGTFNSGQYRSVEMDRLLDAGRRELDPRVRQQIYADAQRTIVADAPAVYLFHEAAIDAWTPALHGYQPDPMWVTRIDAATVTPQPAPPLRAGEGAGG